MNRSQTKQVLALSPLGRVEKCRCGGYDINLPHVGFHLMEADFGDFAALIREAREMESAILSSGHFVAWPSSVTGHDVGNTN